jgi:hypothetical protein
VAEAFRCMNMGGQNTQYLEAVLKCLKEKLNMEGNKDIDECLRRIMALFDETTSDSMVRKIRQHIFGFRVISNRVITYYPG